MSDITNSVFTLINNPELMSNYVAEQSVISNQVDLVTRIGQLLSEPLSFTSVMNMILIGIGGLLLVALILLGLGVVIAFGISLVQAIISYVPKVAVVRAKINPLEILGNAAQNTYLMVKEIATQKFISSIVFFAIVVAVTCVGVFNLVISNFNEYISNSFGTSIPPNTLKVTPKSSSGFGLGFLNLKMNEPAGSVLNDYYMGEIYLLEGVEEIHPYMAVQAPMQALISMFGFRYVTDLVAIGAPYNMVKNDIYNATYRAEWLNWEIGDQIPVMIPQNLLDAYNDSMADANNLPKINENLVIGMTAEVYFGKSSLKQLEDYDTQSGILVGFTDNVPSLALVVPLAVARYYNELYGDDTADQEYVYSFVTVDSHDTLVAVKEEIESWGFTVEAETSLSEELSNLKEIVNSVIKVMMGIIMVLAVFAIIFSTSIATLNRIEYYRILRIMGTSKIFITLTILLKYALIGFIAANLSLWLIQATVDIFQTQFNTVLASLPVGDINLTLELDQELRDRLLRAGVFIPVISTLPAILQMYFRSLNTD